MLKRGRMTEDQGQFRKASLTCHCNLPFDFPGGSVVENPPANPGNTGDTGSIPGQKDLLEGEMTTHSSTLAWKIP